MLADRTMRAAVLAVLILLLLVSPLAAQRATTTGIPTRTIVTVLPKKKNAPEPKLNREDIFVYEGSARDGVVDWMPLQGNNGALELFIVIDQGLNIWFAHQVDDLRAFINKLPPSVAVGVGYMANGTVNIAQNMTTDHARAIKALRVPGGVHGTPGSPYAILADLMSRWPNDPVRRQILLISDGVDPLFLKTTANGTPVQAGYQNPYVDQAVQTALKGNFIIYTMFARGSGGYGFYPTLMASAQGYESQIASATGGYFYQLGFGTGPSISPWLDDLANRLEHQYLLTFLAKPQQKAGFQSVKVKTEVANAEIIAPEKVYVEAAKPAK